eukprot:TRINITY_DN4365_c1_g1_i1.p1 TRINITY_DN4365_c1_g1~~TRINITY_DN4365_c1_g1_i1.p1  ORF type:complete len:280 (+),score=19.68 TRINITY_DN4365_c1_g1_i1:140-979(+)
MKSVASCLVQPLALAWCLPAALLLCCCFCCCPDAALATPALPFPFPPAPASASTLLSNNIHDNLVGIGAAITAPIATIVFPQHLLSRSSSSAQRAWLPEWNNGRVGPTSPFSVVMPQSQAWAQSQWGWPAPPSAAFVGAYGVQQQQQQGVASAYAYNPYRVSGIYPTLVRAQQYVEPVSYNTSPTAPNSAPVPVPAPDSSSEQSVPFIPPPPIPAPIGAPIPVPIGAPIPAPTVPAPGNPPAAPAPTIPALPIPAPSSAPVPVGILPPRPVVPLYPLSH